MKKFKAIDMINLTKSPEYNNHFIHLYGLHQNPEHHHNDAWNHTCDVIYVVDDIILGKMTCGDFAQNQDMDILLFAALLHDIGKGKPECTGEKDGQPTFYGHAKEGVKYAKQFLDDYGKLSQESEKLILWLVEEHMNIHQLNGTKSFRKWIVKQAKSGMFEDKAEMYTSIRFLSILGAADALSKYSNNDKKEYTEKRMEITTEYFDKYIELFNFHMPVSIDDLEYIHDSGDKELDLSINKFILNLCHEGQIVNNKYEIESAVEKRLVHLAS